MSAAKPDFSGVDVGAMLKAGKEAFKPGQAIAGIAQHPGMLGQLALGALLPGRALSGIAGGDGSEAINGITQPEMNLPGKPLPSMIGALPEGANYSILDQLRGQPLRDAATLRKRRAADEAIDPATRARMYSAQSRGLDQRAASAALQYLMGLAPTVVAGRQGRTPRTDVIQQRLAPLYQMGALGQRA
jgi:hypothetical protein